MFRNDSWANIKEDFAGAVGIRNDELEITMFFYEWIEMALVPLKGISWPYPSASGSNHTSLEYASRQLHVRDREWSLRYAQRGCRHFTILRMWSSMVEG